MPEYYYSTQPFLAWIYNTYFYNGKHFAWVATPFYPYKLKNPRTSTPHKIYESLYEMWLDRDTYDCLLPHQRAGIRKGINNNFRYSNSSLKLGLELICDNIDIEFFYPIVYRVDLNRAKADNDLMELLDTNQGSAQIGSNEYCIKNLLSVGYFDLLFADFESEISLKKNHGKRPSQTYADDMIEIRNKAFNKKQVYKILKDYC